jgi:Phage related hypothetical protein (DUF1799)
VDPGYCADCPNKPNEFTPCQDCPAPELLPENIEATRLYQRMNTLWRRDARGVLRGLDYSGIAALFDLAGISISRRKRLFERIQTIESAVLEVDGERRRNNGNAH